MIVAGALGILTLFYLTDRPPQASWLTDEERKTAKTLLLYPDDSIGRLMTPDFLAVIDFDRDSRHYGKVLHTATGDVRMSTKKIVGVGANQQYSIHGFSFVSSLAFGENSGMGRGRFLLRVSPRFC